jgi:gliding motility-associated lipoprotein GldH
MKRRVRAGIFGVLIALMLGGCMTDSNTVFDEFHEVNIKKWSWHEPQTFVFDVKEEGYVYDMVCGLRISGSYAYSNIWLLYTVEGPDTKIKQQFQITLSDKTGKWLGKGMSNLLSYEQLILGNIKLKKGKYTVKISQNMREEELAAVSDLGLKIIKGSKIY